MKARIITTAEGKWINVDDCRRILRDNDEFVTRYMHVMVVGYRKGEVLEGFRRCIAGAIAELAGEMPEVIKDGKETSP